jgi:hypothetical protein
MVAAELRLHCPDDLLDLLCVDIDGNATDSEFQSMILVNKTGRLWLNGDVDTEFYFDVLAEFGVDPVEFVGEVNEHIDLLIRHG